MKTNLAAAAVVALFAVGCGNPADNVPAANTTDPGAKTTAATGAQTQPQVQGKYFTFGPENSRIDFVGSKVTGKHDGGFKNFVGELQVADGKILTGPHKLVIDTTSIWSDNNRLTGHLKNADFFDVQKYPTSTFVMNTITGQGTNWTVTGDLSLHGITKQISFPAAIAVSDDSVKVKSEFSLNRYDFEMKYSGKADDLIRKEVVLKLDVNAAPGRADFSKVEKPTTTASN